MGYHRAGFEVVGVDIQPQPHYPFEFVHADALDVLDTWYYIDGFDAIHASPPCQAYTAYKRRPKHVGKHPELIKMVRSLLQMYDLPWVIENIPGAPLQNPVELCGSAFGLDVRRHRLFELSFGLGLVPTCQHATQKPRFTPASNRVNLRSTVEIGVWRIPLAVQRHAMGIEWMTRAELSQAIPPAYTEWIGRQLVAYVTSQWEAAGVA